MLSSRTLLTGLLILYLSSSPGNGESPPVTSPAPPAPPTERSADAIGNEINMLLEMNPGGKRDLAEDFLHLAFERNNTANHYRDLTVTFLIQHYLKYAFGEARLMLIRLIQSLDNDLDYRVSGTEFKSSMQAAIAYPVQALKLSFSLYDIDNNGFLTKYEFMQNSMLQMDDGDSLIDLWKEASQFFHDRDQNEDGWISQAEFSMHDLYDILLGIAKEVDKEKVQ